MQRMIKRWRSLAICSGLVLFYPTTSAACSIVGGEEPSTATITIPALTVNADTAPGTIIYSQESFGENITVSCNGDGDIYTGYTVLTDSDARSDNPLAKVYQTNVPGIGVRVGWSKDGLAMTEASLVTPMHIGGSRTQRSTYLIHSRATAQFVVTGQVSSGNLDSGQLNADWLYAGLTVARVRFSPVTVNVQSNSCNLVEKNVLAPLSTIVASELANGVSRTVSDDSFKIQLNNCSAGIQVDYQFTTAGSTGVTDGNILNIATRDSAASGVGIQIMDSNDNVLQFDRNYTAVAQTTQDQSVTIPLKARYIKTGNVKAGQVDAVATFAVYYR
ncbi:fimbrial protein [Citrobacter freundii]|nr:fimbrial protein [Citrobacter freundii]